MQLASGRIKFTGVKKRFVTFVRRLKKAAKYAHDSAVASTASSANEGSSTHEHAPNYDQSLVVPMKPKRNLTEEEMWHKDKIKEFANTMIHLVDGEDMIWSEETLVTDDYADNVRFTEIGSSPKLVAKRRVRAIGKATKADQVKAEPSDPIVDKRASLALVDSEIEFNVLSLDMGPNSCLEVSSLAEAPVFMSAVQYEEDLAQSEGTLDGAFSGDNFFDVDNLDNKTVCDNKHQFVHDGSEKVNDSTGRRESKSPRGTCEDVDFKVNLRDEEDPDDATSAKMITSGEHTAEVHVNDTTSADSPTLSVSEPLTVKVPSSEINHALSRATALPKRKRSRLKRNSKKQKKHRR